MPVPDDIAAAAAKPLPGRVTSRAVPRSEPRRVIDFICSNMNVGIAPIEMEITDSGLRDALGSDKVQVICFVVADEDEFIAQPIAMLVNGHEDLFKLQDPE
jgi:hypothetical protein